MSMKETKLSHMDSSLSNLESISRALSYYHARMKFLDQKIHTVVNTIFFFNFSDALEDLFYLKRNNLMKWEKLKYPNLNHIKTKFGLVQGGYDERKGIS